MPSTWYVDVFAANNGNGTSPVRASSPGGVGAINTLVNLSGAGVQPGDTVYARREVQQINGAQTFDWSGMTLIGWPMSGDEDFSTRPTIARSIANGNVSGNGVDWDSDAATMAGLQEISGIGSPGFTLNGNAESFYGDGRVQVKRFKFWGGTGGGGGQALVFNLTASAGAAVDNVYFKYCDFEGFQAAAGALVSFTNGTTRKVTFISCTFASTSVATAQTMSCLLGQFNTTQIICYDCSFLMSNAATSGINVAVAGSIYGPSLFVRCTFTNVNTAVATQAPSTALKITEAGVSCYPVIVSDCTFDATANGTITPTISTVDISGRAIVMNSKVTHGSGVKIAANGASNGQWFGPFHFTQINQSSAAIATGALNCASSTTGNFFVVEVDNFLPASGNATDVTLCEGALVLFKRAVFQSATKTSGVALPGLYCMDQGSTGTFLHQGLRGQIASSTAVTRTGGESWGCLKFNYTDATAPSWIPLVLGFPGMETIFASLKAGSNTITLFAAYKSYTIAPTADDLWFEVDYLDQSSGDHIATASSRANAALTADGSTWNGDAGLTVVKMSVTVTAAQDFLGPIRIGFKRQDASGLTYVDPLPSVSGPGGTPATVHARPWGIGTTGITGQRFMPLGPTEIPAVTLTQQAQDSLDFGTGQLLTDQGYMASGANVYPFLQARAHPANLASDPGSGEFMTMLGYLQTGGVGVVTMTDKDLVLQGPGELVVGKAAKLKVQLRSKTLGALALDVVPQIRIYTINDDGSETNEVGLSSMSQQGVTNSWSYSWTPTRAANFAIEIQGTYGGANLERTFSAIARASFDTVRRRFFG